MPPTRVSASDGDADYWALHAITCAFLLTRRFVVGIGFCDTFLFRCGFLLAPFLPLRRFAADFAAGRLFRFAYRMARRAGFDVVHLDPGLHSLVTVGERFGYVLGMLSAGVRFTDVSV